MSEGGDSGAWEVVPVWTEKGTHKYVQMQLNSRPSTVTPQPSSPENWGVGKEKRIRKNRKFSYKLIRECRRLDMSPSRTPRENLKLTIQVLRVWKKTKWVIYIGKPSHKIGRAHV